MTGAIVGWTRGSSVALACNGSGVRGDEDVAGEGADDAGGAADAKADLTRAAGADGAAADDGETERTLGEGAVVRAGTVVSETRPVREANSAPAAITLTPKALSASFVNLLRALIGIVRNFRCGARHRRPQP